MSLISGSAVVDGRVLLLQDRIRLNHNEAERILRNTQSSEKQRLDLSLESCLEELSGDARMSIAAAPSAIANGYGTIQSMHGGAVLTNGEPDSNGHHSVKLGHDQEKPSEPDADTIKMFVGQVLQCRTVFLRF